MKILYVSRFFKPSWEAGGVTRVSYELAKQFKQQGHNITVYTTNMALTDYHVPLNKKTTVDGITVYYFDNLRRILKKTSLSFPYVAPFIIRKHIREFDVIHIHEYRSFMNLCVAHYARKYHIPYVIQAHGCLPENLPGQNKLIKIVKRIFDNFFGKKMLRGAAGLLALTSAEERGYLQFNVDTHKIHIIPNGISTIEYKNLPGRDIFREKQSIPHGTKIILYLGRLHKTKGIDLLLKAYAEVYSERRGTLLIIAGPDDGMKDNLIILSHQLKINDNVLFLGPVFGRDKLELYCASDLYVMSSEYEAFPMTIFEAMLCGVPVLVTDNIAATETLLQYGGISSPRDEHALATRIVSLLYSNNQTREHYTIDIPRRVESEFAWSKIASDIYSVYEK